MKVRWTTRCAGGCGLWLRVGQHAVRAHRGHWCPRCWARHAPGCTIHQTHATVAQAPNWLTSNYGLVPMGFGTMATAGTYAAGFALLARDAVQRTAGMIPTLAAMLVGVGLSAVLADPHVALASAVAFGTAEVVDLLVYTPLAARGWGRAVLASNAVSAPVDTVVFLWIAGFPITWAAISGQLVGKLLWATLLPLAVYAAARWLLARQRATVAA